MGISKMDFDFLSKYIYYYHWKFSMSIMKKTIGDRIHELRRARKLTQAELANKAGIPAVTLSVTERGLAKRPSFIIIWKIANALEVDLNTFVSGVEMESENENESPINS